MDYRHVVLLIFIVNHAKQSKLVRLLDYLQWLSESFRIKTKLSVTAYKDCHFKRSVITDITWQLVRHIVHQDLASLLVRICTFLRPGNVHAQFSEGQLTLPQQSLYFSCPYPLFSRPSGFLTVHQIQKMHSQPSVSSVCNIFSMLSLWLTQFFTQ